jgi:UDP-glucose 4-epimerase
LAKFSVSLNDADSCWRDENAKSSAWFAKRPNVSIDESLIADLKRRAIETGENTRLSLHSNPDHPLHEMIIVQHRDKFHPPKKHADKDKSFNIIEGRMAVFVFADDGAVEDVSILGQGGNRQYRVGAGVYHADFPITDWVVHFETTLGPFLGEKDSIFAPWAPARDDMAAQIAYRDTLFGAYLSAASDVLVTGAGGRAGGALTERLLAEGYLVTALHRGNAGNLQGLTEGDHAGALDLVSCDLADAAHVPPGTKTVIHAAAELPVPSSSALGITRNNVEATRRLIDAAIEANVERFIFFSAMSIYGSGNGGVISESTPITNPNAYGASKLLGEQMLAEVAGRIPSVSLRLPAIVGAGTQPNWLSRTAEQLRNDEPVRYLNPATPFNNAVHMDDLAEFIISLVGQPLTGASVINLAATDSIPVGELVETLKTELGSSSELTAEEKPDQTGFTIDCTQARERFGWTPMSMRALVARLAV